MDWEWSTEIGAGRLDVLPLTVDRLSDLEAVFGDRGVARKCFCMYWRLPRSGFEDDRDNKDKFARVVEDRPPQGLIGYLDGAPVGWVQVAPRDEFPTLDRSRNLARVDDKEVWSINCFVVRVGYRNTGIATCLAEAAVQWTRSRGGRTAEAYPYDDPNWSSANFFTGTPGMFAEQGFHEVARRKPTRPIVRIDLDES
jgi:GNAT superfamily N-acetyltransferase